MNREVQVFIEFDQIAAHTSGARGKTAQSAIRKMLRLKRPGNGQVFD